MNWVRRGSSTTWFQTSRYCRAKVEFNSVNLVRHGCSTTFETGLMKLRQRRQWERLQLNRFIWAKQHLCTCITHFCTFHCRPCTTTTWNDQILSWLEKGNGKAINFTISFWSRTQSSLFNSNLTSLLSSRLQNSRFFSQKTLSASFQTFCLTAPAYSVNTQKYGLFCNLPFKRLGGFIRAKTFQGTLSLFFSDDVFFGVAVVGS